MARGAGRPGLAGVQGRGRWLAGGLAALVVLLFAGQWGADFLADRWWAAALVPEAASFLGSVRLLRLTLEAAAVLIATAWFTGHLLVVHRAIDSVQISRQVANLEIREALTPTTLLPLALGIGVALGLVAGLGSGREWPVFALAWHGVAYGTTDPLLHRDLGVFVAQLPLWEVLHGFARLLAWGGLLLVGVLYTALGALRWQRRRLAISGHARRHVGLLLAACALTLAWGFVLDPFLAAAGRAPTPAQWSAFELSSLALAGACLAAAAVSSLWAIRGQHLLMVAGWSVLLAGALVVRLVLPGGALAEGRDQGVERISLDRIAYGIDRLEDVAASFPVQDAPGAPSLWTWASIGRMVVTDSLVLEAAAPASIPLGGSSIPVWLVLRSQPGGQASVLAIADGATGAGSGPVSYRAGDTVAYPGLVTFATLAPSAVRPGAPRLTSEQGGLGVSAAGWVRRVVLAWSLQSADLLRPLPEEGRLRWHLAPRGRLERLAPFASWDTPRPVVMGGTLGWVAHGYLSSTQFPGSARILDAGAEVGTLEAGLIGMVDAATGATAIYLAPDAGPLSRSWADLTQGVVRPTSELPLAVWQRVQYPARLFAAQSLVLEQEPWRAGQLAGRNAAGEDDPAPPLSFWEEGSGHALVAPYLRGDDRRVRTLLIGRVGEQGYRPTLLRLSEGGSVPGPQAAEAIWDRFPSYEQMLDSVVRSGQRFERGPYRILPGGDRPIAYQPWYAFDPAGRVTQPYVAVAQGVQAGAGRTFGDAWNNLLGTGAPLPPGFGPLTPLEEARRWMLRADSALHAGDWEGFGRAFGALHQALGVVRVEQ